MLPWNTYRNTGRTKKSTRQMMPWSFESCSEMESSFAFDFTV
jgi:predicted dithiol-disulfide oxidoreductase (DUF899 family)